MSRSVKKGPYVAAKLLKRVEEMNESGKKSVLTAASMCRFTSWKRWLVTSWVSSPRRVLSRVTPARAPAAASKGVKSHGYQNS